MSGTVTVGITTDELAQVTLSMTISGQGTHFHMTPHHARYYATALMMAADEADRLRQDAADDAQRADGGGR